MTTLGRILVVTTVALSLVFLGWATGIYTNRVDWPGTANAPGTDNSRVEVERLRAEIAEWTRDAGLARGDCQRQTQALVQLEKRRPAQQKWYAERMELAEKGPPNEVIEVIQRKDGQVVYDGAGLPAMEPSNPPLRSRQAYQQELAQMNDDIMRRSAEVSQLIATQRQLTARINGERGGPRGLRTLLGEEQRVQENARAETEGLKPERVNLQVEARLLEKRQRSLAARLEELRQAGLAAGQPSSLLDSAIPSRHTPAP